MKKMIVLGAILLLSGCKTTQYIDAIQTFEVTQAQIKEEVPFDCQWDFLEELAKGTLLFRVVNTLDNAVTIYKTGYSPADVLVVDNITDEEWYYNYTPNNTLKVILGESYSIESYYYSKSLTDFSSFSREINEEIIEVFGCDGSEIEKETTEYGSDIYYVYGSKIECSLCDGLASIKYAKSEA